MGGMTTSTSGWGPYVSVSPVGGGLRVSESTPSGWDGSHGDGTLSHLTCLRESEESKVWKGCDGDRINQRPSCSLHATHRGEETTRRCRYASLSQVNQRPLRAIFGFEVVRSRVKCMYRPGCCRPCPRWSSMSRNAPIQSWIVRTMSIYGPGYVC